jgi:hypothetical protein
MKSRLNCGKRSLKLKCRKHLEMMGLVNRNSQMLIQLADRANVPIVLGGDPIQW